MQRYEPATFFLYFSISLMVTDKTWFKTSSLVNKNPVLQNELYIVFCRCLALKEAPMIFNGVFS